MNAKAAAKDFSGYLKREGIPNQYVKKDDLDTILITWIAEEDCPEFTTKIMFEGNTGVVFLVEDLKHISLEDNDYLMELLFATNDLTADDFILTWYVNSYDNKDFQIFVRYTMVGEDVRPSEEYGEILGYLVGQVQEKFSKLP